MISSMDELDKIIEEMLEEDVSPEERERINKLLKEIDRKIRKGKHIIVNGMTEEEFLNIFKRIKNDN